MVKVQRTNNDQLILTIPKKIAEFKGIKKGTKLVFKEHNKNSLIIEIDKKEDANKDNSDNGKNNYNTNSHNSNNNKNQKIRKKKK